MKENNDLDKHFRNGLKDLETGPPDGAKSAMEKQLIESGMLKEKNDSRGKNHEIRCEQEPNPPNEPVKKTIRVTHPHPLVQKIPLNPLGPARFFPAVPVLKEAALFERFNELI